MRGKQLLNSGGPAVPLHCAKNWACSKTLSIDHHHPIGAIGAVRATHLLRSTLHDRIPMAWSRYICGRQGTALVLEGVT
jgi:hypothetical protein